MLRLLTIACLLAACQTAESPTARACRADTDCASPTICQVCNGKCVYAPNAACDLGAPCPCGYSCRNQRCETNLGVASAACTYDRDCPVDQFCNRAQFQCEFPMELGSGTGVTCTSNAQCPDGEICSSALGGADQCAANETLECHNDGECPASFFCSSQGQCEHRSC